MIHEIYSPEEWESYEANAAGNTEEFHSYSGDTLRDFYLHNYHFKGRE